jgi:hypothetical protein
VPELGTLGSVRGAASNGRSYRDKRSISRVPTPSDTRKATRRGALSHPAWSETLACTDTLCAGTGRSRGRPRRHAAIGPHREGEEPKPMMHGHEKSDPAIVAKKPSNNAGQPAAERVERRAGTEGNAGQQSTRRAQDLTQFEISGDM